MREQEHVQETGRKRTTTHMSDDRVRRNASGKFEVNGIHGAQYFDFNMVMSRGYQISFAHMTRISFINTHSELVWLNVGGQIHLARMASVAEGQDPGAEFVYFSA